MHHASAKPLQKILEPYIGRRARLQRLADGKLFAGWLDRCHENCLVIVTSTSERPNEGDILYLEGCGETLLLCMTGSVVGPDNQSGGYLFSGTGEIRFGPVHEASRRRIHRFPVLINTWSGSAFPAFIVDVASHSIGVISGYPAEKGTSITLGVQSASGPLSVHGTVLYCRSHGENGKGFRFGIHVDELPRVEQQRWDRFLAELE